MNNDLETTHFYDRPVVIAGTGFNAEVISSFIEGEGMGSVAAFTVDADHIEESQFLGKPVIALETLHTTFAANEYCVVNSVGYNNMNDTRGRISAFLCKQGYQLPGFTHPSATIDPSVRFGRNLVAVQGVIVEPHTAIGDDVTLWTGCYVGHHSNIGSKVYIGPRAVVPGTVTVGQNVFIGANATIRSKITIGARCLIGAGCYVNQDVPPKTVLKAPAAILSRRTSDDFSYFN